MTLLELLVVTAILSLLLAVLLPSLRKAKDQAKSVCCSSNLRQMVIAAQCYADGCNDYYPLAYETQKVGEIRYYYSWDFTTYKDWSTSPATEVVEPGTLWQGETIEQIQQCPSFKGAHNSFDDPYTGYNYNTSYIGYDETVSPVGTARTDQVRQPAGTAIFGDGQYESGANKYMRAPFSNPRDASFSDPGRAAGTQGFRHCHRTNVGFCDGHVASMKDAFTEMDSIGKTQLDAYNASNEVQIGFLSEDNRIYDLQ